MIDHGGVLPDSLQSNATAVNDHGQVLGWSTSIFGPTQLVLWETQGRG
jgi:hypothetical protein